MNFRSTLIIIVVLAGIAIAYFLILPKPEQVKTEKDKPKIYQVYDLPREKINKLRLTYADEAYQTLTIERKDKNIWIISTPFKADTDIEKVNEMLDDFLNKRVRQTLKVPEYHQYGLENPTITVELWKDVTSSPKTFLIGKKGINFSVYTKEKSEEDIFIIESSALDDLTKSPTDIRDKSVIKFEPETITEIQYQKPEQFICKKDGYDWKITQPIAMNADTEYIKSILTGLHSRKVSTFELDGKAVDSNLEKYGLKNPRIQFSMTDGSETYGLEIGSTVVSSSLNNEEKGYVYVRSVHQGGIYTVTDDIVKLLNNTLFDFRDKRLLDFQRKDVIKFEIQNNIQKIVGIKLQDKTWEFQDNKKNIFNANPKAVSDLIFGADSLEATAHVNGQSKDLAQYGLENPKIKVIFTLQGEEKPVRIHFGNIANDETVYVSVNNSNKIVSVNRDLYDKISKGIAWLRDKNIFNFSIDDPSRLTIKYTRDTVDNGDVQFTCQRLGTNWRLTHPVKENAKNAEINSLLYELIDLKVEEYITYNKINHETTTGLNSPHIQITIELRKQKEYVLQIGKQDQSGKYYARLLDQPDHIFLLNNNMIPKLKTKLKWVRTTD